MEEITGEIEDEHDSTNHVAKQLSDHEYILSARLEISKINEQFDLELPESDEYMTLGGLILHVYQSFPKLNEVVKFDNYEFKIVKNTATKIELVRLTVLKWKTTDFADYADFLIKILPFQRKVVILHADFIESLEISRHPAGNSPLKSPPW